MQVSKKLKMKNVLCALIYFELVFCGCSTRKSVIKTETAKVEQMQTTVRTDTAQRIVKRIETQSIKADTAHLAVSIEQIKRLPSRATFSKQNGRANIGLAYRNDTILISATCDSLQRLVEYYELENRNYKNEITTKKNEITLAKSELIKKKNGIGTVFIWFSIGVFAGATAGVLFTRKTSVIDKIIKYIKNILKSWTK